ncbi:Colicin M [Pseudomonas cedrina]|nr:Colicin M [Pseudomonas cedrina]
MMLNGEGIREAAQRCDSLAVMEQAFLGFSGQVEISLRQDLQVHCQAALTLLQTYSSYNGAPYYIGNGRGDYFEPAWGSLLYSGPITREIPFRANGIDFYGTPLMPLAAIGYWIYGGGQDRNVHIASLNLQLLPRDFQPIAKLLNDPNNLGTFEINEPFSYNIFDKAPIDVPAAGMLGRVSGNVKGTLVIQSDGTYGFNGSYSLNRDYYDADKSNRTWAQEALTTFLKGLGESFGHNDYYINILGEQAVQYSGTR